MTVAQQLPHDSCQAEDRHLTFHQTRNNPLVRQVLTGQGMDESQFALDFDAQVESTLVLLRLNVTQMVVAELFGVWQATVSRVVSRTMPVLQQVLGMSEPTMSDVADGRVLLIDGTFVPTGNRPGQGWDVEKANYSGTHHLQCVNIQVACVTDGTLATVSEPVAGARHDAAALRLCGWDGQLEDTTWIADTGYVGTNAITPRKKPRGVKRSEADTIFTKSVSSVRAAVEHAIRHLKEWKVLATALPGPTTRAARRHRHRRTTRTLPTRMVGAVNNTLRRVASECSTPNLATSSSS